MSSSVNSTGEMYVGRAGWQWRGIWSRKHRLCIGKCSGRCRTQDARMRPTVLNWRRRRAARARLYACVYRCTANVVLYSACNILHAIARCYRIDLGFKVTWISWDCKWLVRFDKIHILPLGFAAPYTTATQDAPSWYFSSCS